jgi:hypothetical protein
MDRQELEGLSRDALIDIADRIGVTRPRVLTHAELVDEILTRTIKSERERAKARGWLGRARDLIARVIEKGLHLPETARALGVGVSRSLPPPPPPLPTVTLAEIYAAQGHLERAIDVLDEVLAREPEHKDAASLRQRFVAQQLGRPRSRTAREPRPKPEAPSLTPSVTEADPTSKDGVEPAPGASKTATTTTEPRASEVQPPSGSGAGELPSNYEIDEVVAIGVDPRSVYLYWEARDATLQRARERRPDGHLALRIVSVRPSWEGPDVRTREVAVELSYGDMSVRELEPGSIIRISLGWSAEGDFQPIAIANEVTTARAARSSRAIRPEVTRWHDDASAADAAPAAADDRSALREWPVGAGAAPSGIGHGELDEELDEEVDELGHGDVVRRTARWPRGGASELAWDELNEEDRALRRARQKARALVRGGASELVRGGASELGREVR